MSRATISLIVFVAGCTLGNRIETSSQGKPKTNASQPAKTEVVVIGTIHGAHHEMPSYSPEVLREILLALKPDAILNELPPSQVEPDGRPKFRNYNSPEGWAADQAALKLHVPQIPYDRPDRNEFYAKTRYFERQSRFYSLIQQWAKELEGCDPENLDLALMNFMYDMLRIQPCFNESPRLINSRAYDELMVLKHIRMPPLRMAILKKYPDYYAQLADDAKFLQDEWIERNGIMAENIEKAARQYPGGRLVVITGSEHRYVLRDLLGKKDAIVLKEYWELVDVDPAKVPASDERREWETDCHRLFRESPAVCREYWEALMRGDWEKVSKVYPAQNATQWKQHHGTAPIGIVRIGESYKPRPEEGTTLPVTPCIVKYADGKMQEIKMLTDIVEGRCVILFTLGSPRDVSPEEIKGDTSSAPTHE